MLLEKRIPLNYLFRQVQPDVVVSMTFAGALIVLEHSVPAQLREPFEIPVAIPAFLGTAISLVLSFKLAQSYDRWWEARKIWGAIVNDGRSLVVQLLAFGGTGSEDDPTIRRIVMRQIAWNYVLTASLRKLDPRADLEKLLPPEDVDEVSAHTNQPLKIAAMINCDIASLHSSGRINDFQQVQMDSTMVRLVASMGKAERIKSTVFPKTYRLFLRMFIYVFIFTLAVSLADLEAWFEMILLVSIGLPFFMLMRTALYMQDPFENRPTDTAMYTVSRTIEINLRQLINDENVPEPAEPNGFYSM